MREKPRRRREEEWELVPLPPELAAQMTRRTHILIGLVPLDEMTQEEADWLFAQKVRLAGDQQGR
ncbi:hypothetical protein J0H58_09545 [bacterium]|nr:hypothetical protein [bacterium]